MNGRRVSDNEIQQIIKLRRTGHSLPEIMQEVGRGSSTVFRYTKDADVLPRYQSILKSKQGGSITRSKKNWLAAKEKAGSLFPGLDQKSKLLILASLYWGEGAKKDLSLINSDPDLVKTFISCLQELGVSKDKLRITIRTYSDLERDYLIGFWAKFLGIPRRRISNVNVLSGKKKGKLKYGMCRVRVSKGGQYFKIIQSLIELIKTAV